MACRQAVFTLSSLLLLVVVPLTAQAPVPPPPARPASAPMVEKLGPNLFRLGQIRVDTSAREVSVAGTVNDVGILEFVANTRGGMKAYESALTLDTDGVTFNAALVLIGLDRTHARVPTRHFDPDTPEGDPVEIWIDIPASDSRPASRIAPEQFLYDKNAGELLQKGNWVYTGSTLFPNGGYLADSDGVLIGFVHSPAPVIENPRGLGVRRYGQIVMNPSLGLAAGTAVTLTVKAATLPH